MIFYKLFHASTIASLKYHIVADSKRDPTSMKESFFLSNIVPQNFENNVGFWYRLEEYCRSLSKRFSDVYVISGPLFLSDGVSGENEAKFVKYQVRLNLS